ncbi:MAG: DUF5106 domain-containing protein [Lentimicrobiaceae bacterium]|jgi:peroxiredoxin|nr:DUF5106 domain-containing protein [Lentimicrobiaceae bacterium]
MRYFRIIFIFCFLIGIQLVSEAQVAISIELEGNQDTTFYLAYYHGDKFRMIDTTETISGKAVFRREESYPEGVYILTNKAKNRLTEFLLGSDQKFTLKIPSEQSNAIIECEGALETCLFFEHLNLTQKVYSRLKELNAKDALSEVEKTGLRKDLEAKIWVYRDSIIIAHPQLFISNLFLAMKEPVVPDSIAANQNEAYFYYKDHFWDTFDLKDDRLIRTPLLVNKIKLFFDKVVLQIPDSIAVEIDKVIAKTGTNTEMRDFLLWQFMDMYQNPKFMGMDKVFVHLSDTYFSKLDIAYMTPSVQKSITDRADVLRKLLLGSYAPNLILVDTTDALLSLMDVNSEYTVVFFWDPDCGVCKKELKELKALYDSKKYPMEVFAVASNPDFDKWKKIIREQQLDWINVNGMKSATADFHDLYDIASTPVIYVLDKQKRIIGKKIQANQVGVIIDNFYQ